MKNKVLLHIHSLALLLMTTVLIPISHAQQLTQTVRGRVYDADNKQPLEGVLIRILDGNAQQGVVTDSTGSFRLEQVAIGRITIVATYVNYEQLSLPDIQVITGKETVLDVPLQEMVKKLQEVVVINTAPKGAPVGEMALASVRSISPDETNRFAGGFNDPARILSNFAGVNNSQDGSADVIVRGNSPKYLQWRLEGAPIGSPAHFADPSGLGTNGISALNNNILATSDFYTGAFPAEYGNALSGVYDVQLRSGNNEKREGIVGLGITGTDITLEGPFKKGYGGSYLVNYRYSTVAIISKLGLLKDLGGVPLFQDGAFKIQLPTKRLGKFSLYGLTGISSIKFENVNPSVWETPGNNGMQDDITEDFRKKAHLFNAGINHTIYLTKNTYLKTNLSIAEEGVADKVIEKIESLSARDNFKSDIRKRTLWAATTLNSKLSAKTTLQVGANYALNRQRIDISQLDTNGTNRIALAQTDAEIASARTFLNLKHHLFETLTVVAGLHNTNVLFNNKHTLEPRLAMRWRPAYGHALQLAYGLHSTMEAAHHYFAKVKDASGNLIEPNHDLGLLKAHHFVLGYENRQIRQIRIKADAYYQYLYNLPVENDRISSYATINENLDPRFTALVNKGTGYNLGLELTVERFFNKNYYFLINTTIFTSKYTALDGIERNTAFNSNYLANLLCGKDFINLGKRKNKTIGINSKVFVGGGRRIIPLLRDADGELAVDPANNQYYDYGKSYAHSLDGIYNITLSLSYKWSKAKRTNEIFLNIDNLTNNRPRLSEYYDSSEPGQVGYLRPIGIFPNLMYRLYF